MSLKQVSHGGTPFLILDAWKLTWGETGLIIAVQVKPLNTLETGPELEYIQSRNAGRVVHEINLNAIASSSSLALNTTRDRMIRGSCLVFELK